MPGRSGAPRGNAKASRSIKARDLFTTEQWDDLFDGERHQVDLYDLTYDGGIGDFRSAVYRQAEKRNGYATTRRLDATVLEIQALNGLPLKRLAPPVTPAPQEQPPTTDFPADELDDEALLGPCTCGLSPQCLPTCARAGGQAA